MKWLLVFLPLTLIACKPKMDEKIEESAVPAEIALADVSSEKCLNLEKFSRVFQSPNFLVPAALMTTDLKPISEMTQSKVNYFSYATFYYKAARANELGLFSEIRQKDCKTVQMLSASEEVLTYEVVSSNEKQITIKFLDKFRETLNKAHKEALFERQQPYQYTFTYLTPNSMVISEKYKTVDPLCTTKDPLNFEVRKKLSWAGRWSDLPQSYEIESKYLTQVKDSLMPEALSLISSAEISESFSVDAIRAVMRSSLRDELKLCSQ